MRMYSISPTFMAGFALLSTLGLMGCEMTSPSRVNISPITVEEHRQEKFLSIESVTPDLIQDLAEHYSQYGKGPISVLVLYPAGGAENMAQKNANHIANMLREAGLPIVQTETMPVSDPLKSGHVRIEYISLKAHAPKGCSPHPADSRPDVRASEDGLFPDYRFGCGVDSYIAGQVARPADLLGKSDIDAAAGERGSAQLKDYREGKPFKELKGLNASELKTQ